MQSKLQNTNFYNKLLKGSGYIVIYDDINIGSVQLLHCDCDNQYSVLNTYKQNQHMMLMQDISDFMWKYNHTIITK
jgi:hypothetical protein